MILKDHDYCVVLWNDDKHLYEEIIKLLADLTRNISREERLNSHIRSTRTGGSGGGIEHAKRLLKMAIR